MVQMMDTGWLSDSVARCCKTRRLERCACKNPKRRVATGVAGPGAAPG